VKLHWFFVIVKCLVNRLVSVMVRVSSREGDGDSVQKMLYWKITVVLAEDWHL